MPKPAETLDELVRDLTKVHPLSKSEVRRLINTYFNSLAEEIIGPGDNRETKNHGVCNPACHAISEQMVRAEQRQRKDRLLKQGGR